MENESWGLWLSRQMLEVPYEIAVFGLGVFSMARRHALVSLRHALVSLRHAAPSQRHAAFFFFLGLALTSIIMWMKRDDKLTNFMTYGGSYTLLDFSVQCPGPGQLLQTVSSVFS